MRLSNISIDISLSDSRSIKMDKSVKMDVTISSIINLLQNSVNEEDVLRILKRYIEKNTISKVDIRKHSNSLLVIACNKNYLEAIEFLISLGANVNVKDNKGITPLHGACSLNNTKLAKLLLERGADLEAKDNNGMTPFYYALASKHVEIAQLLLDAGANLDIKDNKGYYPLQISSILDDLDTFLLLLENGGNPKLKSECGNNALHLAILSNSKNIVFHLLKRCDVDVNLKNNKGILPINLTDNKLIQNLLIEHGAYIGNKKELEKNNYLLDILAFSVIILFILSRIT